MRKMKFVIVSPKVYAGGPIALHELCRELERQGHRSKVFYINNYIYKDKVRYWIEWIKFTLNDLKRDFNKKKDAADSLGACKRKIIPWVTGNTIVVYPEMVYGNILNANKCVRWLLSYNKYKNDPNAYSSKDLFVCFRLQFNDELLNPKKYVLRTVYFNFDLYKRTNYGERKGTCYVIYKGRNRNDLPEKYDGIIVDELPEKEKVKVFNECEYCFCYDMQSAYASIAALCGCIVIRKPETGKEKEFYYKEDDKQTYGVAFGSDQNEVDFARRTQPMVKEYLENLTKGNKKSVSNFVKICCEYFGCGVSK